MKRLSVFVMLALTLSFWGSIAYAAVQPSETMDNPQLEKRARYLYSQLRCVTCESQSIAGSNADMAQALRALVRKRLRAGDTNDEVLSYLQKRYGDTVLMRPPVTGYTWFLWALPVLALIAGMALVRGLYRRPS